MAYRKNPTDKQQEQLERATFNQGAPVFVSGKTRIVAGGAQTATQRTENSGANGALRSNAGVIIPHDDYPCTFKGDTQGKA